MTPVGLDYQPSMADKYRVLPWWWYEWDETKFLATVTSDASPVPACDVRWAWSTAAWKQWDLLTRETITSQINYNANEPTLVLRSNARTQLSSARFPSLEGPQDSVLAEQKCSTGLTLITSAGHTRMSTHHLPQSGAVLAVWCLQSSPGPRWGWKQ
jgi:hypothetical protein